MEKISKQIDYAIGNCQLARQLFCGLEEILSKSLEADCDRKQSVELKFLWDRCGHHDYAIALEACLSVIRLTLKGLLTTSESLTNLVICASSAKHHGILVDSVASLLDGQKYSASTRHPFITLLEMRPETWPYIYQQMSSLLSYPAFSECNIHQMKPFVIHVLCHGDSETRLGLWSLLMTKLNYLKSTLLANLLLESLVWQKGGKIADCGFHLSCVQQLCEYSIHSQDEDLGQVTAVLLASAMQWSHTKFGFSVDHSISLLKELDNTFTLWLEPIIILISAFLLECHSNCYEPVLDLCLQLANQTCNRYIWSMLQCAVLSIFAYSTEIESSVIELVELARNQICISGSDISSNPYAGYLERARIEIQLALATTEKAILLESDSRRCDTLEQLITFQETDSVFLLNCAIFWLDSQPDVLQAVVRYVSAHKKFANSLLTLLLKKLTIPSKGELKLIVLYSLPQLAVDQVCVPRVLQLLDALSAQNDLEPLRLNLLIDLWKIQDRTYPYLEKAIFKQLQTDEFLIAKASAIEIICSLRPDKYGPDLLNTISDLLNVSLCSSKPNSATIATLALRSLVSLCRAEVVDLKSVWDILAPKLLQEHRPSVMTSMCHLLQLAPKFRVDTEEYQSFIHLAITTLFRISIKSDNVETIAQALRSLSHFAKDDFHLKCMPDICKDDVKIPSKYLAGKADTPQSSTAKAEDLLDHVPSSCWMKLLDVYKYEVVESGLVQLLTKLADEEIQNMPAWVYRKAATDITKKNEPNNYNSVLKEDSILAGLVQYTSRICEINEHHRSRMVIVFQILASKFPKPLPPLDWTCLQPIVQQYDLLWKFLPVVFQQAAHSFSAQTIVENLLSGEQLQVELVQIVFSHLVPICQCVKVKMMEDFIGRVFNENQSDWLSILEHLSPSLSDEQLLPQVRQIIATYLNPLLPILPGDILFIRSFADCYRFACQPNIPTSMTPIVARKYVQLFCIISNLSTNSATALEYLQKALQATLYMKSLDGDVLRLIYEAVRMNCLNCPTFLQQFMSYVQLVTVKQTEEYQNVVNLIDVFSLLVSILSGSLVFTDLQDLSNAQLIWRHFPLSINSLINQPHWIGMKKYIIDWILDMLERKQVGDRARKILMASLPTLDISDKEVFSKMTDFVFNKIVTNV